MRGLFVNQKFFTSWTPNMSYVLGLTVADGCIGIKRIRKRDGAKQYYFNITSKDKNLLEKVKKAMRGEQKVYRKSSDYTNEKKYYFIQIGHQKICNDLIRLGVWPNKTYSLEPIEVPNEYFPDFVRGFFDGDGSVYIYKVNKETQIKVGFVRPNLSFIQGFNQNLCKKLNIPLKSIHRDLPRKKNQTLAKYSIIFYIEDCEKLAEFMYGNNPALYLDRKRIIFKKWKSIKRRNYIKRNYPSKIGWQLNKKLI